MRRVVGIIDAEIRIGDQQDRSLIESVLGVHHAAWLADLHQRGSKLRARRREGWQRREYPSESILANGERGLRLRRAAHQADAGRHRARTDAQCAEKTASTQ